MKLTPSSKIYATESQIEDAGRGVFAAVDIKEGDVIEICPVVMVPENQVPLLRQTELYNYYFMWGTNEEHHAAGIALGFGSIYNHSYSPNATYKKLLDKHQIKFEAIKPIEKDEEITVNYNYGDPHDQSQLWIESIPPSEHT